jgi:hypothetical protein
VNAEQTIPRCGDHVRHIQSGEVWVVAYADDFVVAPAGWPNSRAQTKSCEIVRHCSDADHKAAVEQWCGVRNDSRTAHVLRMYGDALTN